LSTKQRNRFFFCRDEVSIPELRSPTRSLSAKPKIRKVKHKTKKHVSFFVETEKFPWAKSEKLQRSIRPFKPFHSSLCPLYPYASLPFMPFTPFRCPHYRHVVTLLPLCGNLITAMW
jgi:hypothetical protein